MSSPVWVEESGQGRYQQTVRAGAHTLVADEPPALGGDDRGPAPFDYVLAGLGACTSITLRMYAERKGLALTHVAVALQHETIEVDGVKRPHIRRDIRLSGELTGAERQRLLDIANKCPVHKALSQSFVIDSALDETVVN